ncbi:hypothetical protein EDD86DRAFT_252314 [Gorgonomyces haynaldii]|nr:hypothetical protein EDD86DRAFT_252314 [Gorgonomyces haynaldii]
MLINIAMLVALIYAIRARMGFYVRLQMLAETTVSLFTLNLRLAFVYLDAPPWVSYLGYLFQHVLILVVVECEMEILKQMVILGSFLRKSHVEKLQIGWFVWYLIAMVPAYAQGTRIGLPQQDLFRNWDNVTYIPWLLSSAVYETFQTIHIFRLVSAIRRKQSLESIRSMRYIVVCMVAIFILDFVTISLWTWGFVWQVEESVLDHIVQLGYMVICTHGLLLILMMHHVRVTLWQEMQPSTQSYQVREMRTELNE